MSQFNLLPWRERKRALRMRSWQIGVGLSLGVSAAAVYHLDRLWDEWLAHYRSREQQTQQSLADLKLELKDNALWTARERQTQQVQAEWQTRLQQQARSWQVLQQLLSVPPQGVQIERMLWHDQQIQLSGWALSAGHGQAWLTGLALAGALIQADKAQWEEPNWRMVQGLAAKQHRFQLQIGMPPLSADKP